MKLNLRKYSNVTVTAYSKMEIAPWQKVKILGSGGFGQVILWYNGTTKEALATKKVHESVLRNPATGEKVAEKWRRELEVMKSLNHRNIVSTVEVPEELKKISSVPMLGMEYCSKGNLRQMLQKPENCCGLKEPQVLNILKDLSSAVEYMHSFNIIHKDIKPENIVMQEKDSVFVYKLIDLGYAKVLDTDPAGDSFECKTHYTAPELFFGKAYTSSVDYWSLGILTHEIITGFRPFMPSTYPTQWMEQIKDKARDIICAVEEEGKNVTLTSFISRVNHVSRCFLKDIEGWLQLALDWDGETRGRDSKNALVIFEELKNILGKKIIRVFSIPTYETLFYEVKPETNVTDLKEWLKNDTGLEVDDQLLIIPGGKELNGNGALMTALAHEKFDRKGITIFFYKVGEITLQRFVQPKFVEEIMSYRNQRFQYKFLRTICSRAIYFLMFEADRFRNLFLGIKTKIEHTKLKTLANESLYEEFWDEWNRMEGYSDFLSMSDKVDLKNYIFYRRNGKLDGNVMVRSWVEKVLEVERKMNALKCTFNRSEQKQLILVARQRCQALDTDMQNEGDNEIPLERMITEGHKLWIDVQKVSDIQHEVFITNDNAMRMVKKYTAEITKFIDVQMTNPVFPKIVEADQDITKFFDNLTTLLKSAKLLKVIIENTQKDRQKDVWDLVGIKLEPREIEVKVNWCEDVLNEKPQEDNRICVFELAPPYKAPIEDGAASDPNCKEIVKYVPSSDSDSDLSSDDSNDVSFIINDNNHLRYRIQDAQQSCYQMVNEIRAFKWDFMEEL